jgi:GNAT superfamily N-acetyltransferase
MLGCGRSVTTQPTYRAARCEPREVNMLAALLEAYMRETFGSPWKGSAEALARDGFGARFELTVAVLDGVDCDGSLIGFAAWYTRYDLHHCLHGVEVMDLYVERAHRGRGVAIRLLARIAADAAKSGACFLAGQAVEDPAMHRLYRRFTQSFSGLHCYLSGRAFNVLTGSTDRPLRALVRSLPPLG